MDFRELVENKTLLVFVSLSVLLFLTGIVLVYVNLGNLSFPLILHFNDYEGVDLVGDTVDLWGVVVMEGVVVFMNILIATFLLHRERLLAYILLSANVLITFLGLVGIANIISLN